jgi:hypothetical protein
LGKVITLSISPQDKVYGASPAALLQPLVGSGLAEDLVDEAELLFVAEALALDLEVDEAFAEIWDWADFETELRLGEEIAIFEADDAFDGGAVGDAEGLLDFTALDVGLAAADEALLGAALLVDSFDETADECKVDAMDFELDLAGVLFAGAAGLVEAADLEACGISIR